MTWKALYRRYRLPGRPEERGMVLYNPAAMRIIRYRYRGNLIATPWNDVDRTFRDHRKMAFNEVDMLRELQERLTVAGLTVESRMSGNAHVRFGGAGRGN